MKYRTLFLLLLLSLLPLVPLLVPGLPITHDGRDHVARIANFYLSLTEGNLIPRWAGNLNWGYGHPILMFLYPLSSYIASFFIFLGFSYIDSTKLVFALAYVMSGLSMYLWLQSFLGRRAAVIGALLYLFAPYRFVDLYVRGAIGEHMAFVFPPLILYFMKKYKDTKKAGMLLGGAVALAALILSHNAVSLMFIPVIFFYGVYLLWQRFSVKSIVSYFIMMATGFGMSAFFWVPAFFEGKYTLRDIVITQDYSSRLYPFMKFVISPWSFGISGDFSLQIGLIHWLAILVGLYVVYRLYQTKNSLWLVGAAGIGGFIVTLFLMIPPSLPIWQHVSLLQKFQFPWRFLTLSVFFTSVVGALITEYLRGKRRIVYSLLGFVIIVSTISFWRIHGSLNQSNAYFSRPFASTTDTGESAPIWSVRFMEAFPKAPIEVIGGDANIVPISRKIERHSYSVTATASAQLRENTLYFPGWKVLEDGREIPIDFQDANNRGVITFLVSPGQHTIDVVFSETKLRQLANLTSIISLCLLLLFVILNERLVWQRSQ